MEFEEFFRQSFDGAELTPSNKVWEHIEQDLNQNETPRHRLAVWCLSGLAAMVLLSFFAYLLLWNPVAPMYSTSSASVANNVSTAMPIAENTNNTTIPTGVEPNTKTANVSTIPQVVQTTVETNAQKIQRATTTNKSSTIQSSSVKKYATTTQNAKNNFVANSKTMLMATTDKNTVDNNVTPLGNEEKASALPLATQFNTLVPSPFQLLPFKDLKGKVILAPIQTPTSNPTPQVTNNPNTQKNWVAVQGFYGSYTPNFSDVQDGAIPNAYLSNSINKGFNYDQNTFATDLAPLKGTTFSVGIEAGRTLWKGFGLKSGVLYTENQFQFNKEIFAVVVSVANSKRQIVISNTIQQIGVPISAFYQQDMGKFTVGVHAGIQTDMLLSNTVTNSRADEGHTVSFGTYKSLTFSGMTGLQVGYQIVPRMQLFIESSYRQSLSSVYDTPLLQAQPSWFNVGSSLRYKF